MDPDSVSSREELGRALTDIRQNSGHSVREVAVEAQALLGTVAGWFAGQHAPTQASREMFVRVLQACGVTDAGEVARWWAAAVRSSRRSRRRATPQCPYRGFEPFGNDDGAWFFGRDDIINKLVAKVSERADSADASAENVSGVHAWVRGVLVVGASGVGKSSLARAGLVGRLGTPGPLQDWRVAVMMPGDDPMAALEQAWNALQSQRAHGPGLLVLDQLEEFWTQNDPAARTAFTQRLAEYGTRDRIVVVGVVRADFYGWIARSPALAPVADAAQVLVPPMTAEQLREVIVAPAAVVGAEVDADLVDMLLDDLTPGSGSGRAADTGVLPLLSHALRATWNASDGRRLRVGDYLATGRISGAVEQTAEAVYTSLLPDEQVIARRVLLAMINVDEDTVTRRTVRLAELGIDPPQDGAASRVLATFADARLVTVGESHAQVAHEALLTAWPRLGVWIDADRERLLLRRRLHSLREPWEANGRPDDLLPARARLELFRPLLDSEGESLDRVSREYLAAGAARVRERDAHELRRTRQLRRVAWFAGIVGMVAILAAVTAVVAGLNAAQQRRQAEDATARALSRQLSTQSAELADRDPLMSAQLAMIAYQTSPTLEARSQLITATAHGVPARFSGQAGSVLLARSGPMLAAAGGGGQVRIFGVDENGITAVLGDFRAPGSDGRLGGVAFVPNTPTLLLGGRGSITAWDVSDPKRPVRRYEFPDVRGTVNALQVSPDGRFVVASEPDIGLQAWVRTDATWTPIMLPEKVVGRAGAAAFSPDGRALATSSANRRIDLWRVQGDALVPSGEIALDDWRDNELAQGLVYTPDGTRLAAALRSRVIQVFDVTDPAAAKTTARCGGFNSYVSAVAVSADGTRIVGAGADNTVRIFDLRNPAAAPIVHTGSSNASAVQFVGSHVIASSDDGRVQDWPTLTDTTRVGTNSVFQIPADGTATRVLAADTGTDGRITQWHVSTAGLTRAGPDLVPPPGLVYSGAVTMSPSGRVATMGTVTGVVHFADYSDPGNPHVVGTVVATDTLNETVDYSERSGLAVTGAADSPALTVIDASDLRAPRVVARWDAGGGILWASLSPDGRTAALATTTGAVKLLDLGDPRAPRAYPNPIAFSGAALAVRFDATGKRIVASSEERSVIVADIADPSRPQRLWELTGPAGQLYSAGFSADGNQVVAGGGNSEVWVWDLRQAGQARAVLRSFPGRVYDVRFVSGNRILAAGQGGIVQDWSLDADETIAAQCARPGDQITEAEWRTYVTGLDYRPPCGA